MLSGPISHYSLARGYDANPHRTDEETKAAAVLS